MTSTTEILTASAKDSSKKLPKFRLPKIPIPSIRLFTKTKKILIIEIGEAWLKMVTVVEQSGRRKVMDICAEAIKDVSELEVSDKISAFLKSNLFKPSELIVLHPSHNLTTRILSLPSTDPKEIGDIIELQAVKQTPYNREEITTGYCVIDQNETGYSSVLLAISHRDVASRYLRTVEIAGLAVDRIAISIEGIQNWYKEARRDELKISDQPIALLDLDSSNTDFLVLKKSRILYTRSIALGAKQLSEGDANTEADFIREIQRSLESGEAEVKGEPITQILVTGFGAMIYKLPPAISKEVNLPCEAVPLFKSIEKSFEKKVVEKAENLPCSFAPLLGFAIDPSSSKINLIPTEIQLRKELEDRAKDLAVLGTVLLAFVTLVSAISFEKIYGRNKYVRELSREYESVRAEAEDVERVVAKMRLAQEHMNAGGGFLDVLRDISEVLPPTMYLTYFQFNAKDKVITVRGISEEMSAVFQVLSTLEATEHLEFVKTKNVTKRKVQDKEVAEFEITANVIQDTPGTVEEGKNETAVLP